MLETDDPVNHEAEDDSLGDIVGDAEGDIDLINEPQHEVTRALISLKNGKAPGPDGIIGEIFKNASDVVLDFFVKLFNEIFNKEYILKTVQTQSCILYTKNVTQMIQIITGVFLSQMLVGSCLVLLLTAGYKCGLT